MSDFVSPTESSKDVNRLREMAGLLLEARELVARAREVERLFNYRVKLAERVNACIYPLDAVLDELELSLRRWS
jgi:hypothetical protein